MADYTPTTEDVRCVYADLGGSHAEWAERNVYFDRWLMQVKADVWTEGEAAGWNYAIYGGSPSRNPYDQEQGHLKDLRD